MDHIRRGQQDSVPLREGVTVGCRARLLSIPLLFVACGGGAVSEPGAEACAQVVKRYQDLQGGVRIVGGPQQSPEGTVEIRYEATGAMNLPVEGVAACTFAPGAGGSLELVTAIIDGQELQPDAIEAAKRAVGGDR